MAVEPCMEWIPIKKKTAKETPESSRLEFLEKFSAKNFTLSDGEDNSSWLLNIGGTTDLTLLRMLLAISKKAPEGSFWEMMGSFVTLACASLAPSRTLLQWLLAFLNFTLDSEDLFFWHKQKK